MSTLTVFLVSLGFFAPALGWCNRPSKSVDKSNVVKAEMYHSEQKHADPRSSSSKTVDSAKVYESTTEKKPANPAVVEQKKTPIAKEESKNVVTTYTQMVVITCINNNSVSEITIRSSGDALTGIVIGNKVISIENIV